MASRHSHAAITRGSAVAIAAAILFGITTPVVKHFGVDMGPFTTAALLYVGAAIAAAQINRDAGSDPEPRPTRKQLPRIVVMAVFGAVLAPVALAWGLQHTSALAASLLLGLEAAFTVILAGALYREPIGKRVVLAVAVMAAGTVLLALRNAATGASTLLGMLAVCGASAGWAIDNVLSRPLADFDPRAIVFAKATVGATLSLAMAAILREGLPGTVPALVLIACGGTGYGYSLRLYLHAQRSIGAARTGSLFAIAPFVGAAVAFAAGDRAGLAGTAVAGALFALGVYLHATERHGHRHHHDPVEHEHAHRHDDAHHDHVHDPPFVGEHTHLHRHESVEHDHPHGVDIHHRHRHD